MGSYRMPASDWEIRGICSLDAALGAAIGVWFFDLRSAKAGYPDGATFAFIGFGAGGALNAGAVAKGVRMAGGEFLTLVKMIRAGRWIDKALDAQSLLGKAFNPALQTYTKIPQNKPFSLYGLEGEVGTLAGISGGAGPGYTYMRLALWSIGTDLWKPFNAGGMELAVGLGGQAVLGVWLPLNPEG